MLQEGKKLIKKGEKAILTKYWSALFGIAIWLVFGDSGVFS